MIRERLARYRDRARRELTAAFQEEHTPHEIGVSFGIGVFVTAMPTGGLGIGLFFVFASLWSWISKPAIFASVAVLNPLVKPAVYVASFQLGGVLLGPRSVQSVDASAETAGLAVQQLLVGNVVIAIVLSILGYVIVVHMTRAHRRRKRRSGTTLVTTLLGPFRRQ